MRSSSSRKGSVRAVVTGRSRMASSGWRALLAAPDPPAPEGHWRIGGNHGRLRSCTAVGAPGNDLRADCVRSGPTGTRPLDELTDEREEQRMSAEDKAGNTADKVKGKVKETAGKAVGNERLTAEGRADQAKGDAKQAVEKAKDVFKD